MLLPSSLSPILRLRRLAHGLDRLYLLDHHVHGRIPPGHGAPSQGRGLLDSRAIPVADPGGQARLLVRNILGKPLAAAVGLLVFAAGACSSPETANLQATITAERAGLAESQATSMPVLSATATPSPTAAPAPTLSQVLDRVRPSVVRVRTEDNEGTGFVAFQAGQVLTAFHVVASVGARPTVVALNGDEYRAVVYGADEEADLALLIVAKLEAAALHFSAGARVGEAVIAIGYAAGLAGEASITRGIVSAKRHDPETGLTYVQTDAPLNPGSSGGPLLNERGEVVGMNFARLRGRLAQYENLGFALNAESLLRVGDGLRAGAVRVLPAATPKPDARPQAPPKPQPTVVPFVVREYPEERQDGGFYLVQQWSDGRFTTPLFIVFESGVSPITGVESRTLSFATRAEAICETRLPELPLRNVVATADANGRIRVIWNIREDVFRFRPLALGVNVTCTYGAAKLYAPIRVPVQR